MNDPIDRITRNTQRYWYVDGIAEIAIGIFFVLLSAYFYLVAWLSATTHDAGPLSLGLMAIVLIVVMLGRRAILAVKSRLTFPRTGYVAFPQTKGKSRWQRYGLAASVGLIAALLVGLLNRWQNIHSWIPLINGAICALAILSLSYRFHLARLAFLACGLVMVGLVISLINPGEPYAMALSSLADGLCFTVSGGITLIRYLRSTQPPSEAEL